MDHPTQIDVRIPQGIKALFGRHIRATQRPLTFPHSDLYLDTQAEVSKSECIPNS